MRGPGRLLAPLAVAVLLLAPHAAYAAWSGSGAGAATVTATSVGRSTAPTVLRGAGKVTLSWAATTLANGTPVATYDVVRHSAGTSTTVCSGVTARTCDDLSPLPGAVQYGVVARIGATWKGAESPLTSFTYDQTAPVTSMATAPASPNAAGWFDASVTVTLSATDAGGALASGVKEIHYTVNGGSTVVVSGSSASFVLTQEQISTVTYAAVDKAGNTESPVNQGQVKLDRTAPVSTLAPASSTAWTTQKTVTLSALDATSGVATLFYKVDGAASYTTYTGPFALADGSHTVTYYALDVAGNAESARTATIKVDTTAPVSGASPASGSTPRTVTLSAADTGSGVASIAYKLDGASAYTLVTGSSATVSVPSGNHTLAFHAVDTAGNVEADNTDSYGDDTGPTVTPSAPVQGGSYATSNASGWAKVCGSGHVCATVADTSGVASVGYTLSATAGSHAGRCWNGSAFVAGTGCSVAMTVSGSTWSGADIARATLGAGTWSLTYRATDTLGNLTTVTITFTTT